MSFLKSSNWIAAAVACGMAGILFTVFFAGQPLAAQPTQQDLDSQEPQEKNVRKVRIRVLAPDNAPIKAASLFLNTSGHDPVTGNVYVINLNGKTDENAIAEFTLPVGLKNIRVWVAADGYTPLYSNWEKEEIKEGELQFEEFTFEMINAVEIGGMFVDEDGNPIQGVAVEVRGSSKIAIPNKKIQLSGTLADGDDAVFSAADGSWQLNNAPPGDGLSISLTINHPDFISDEQIGDIQRSQSIKPQEFLEKTAKIVLRKGIPIRGRVADHDGHPIRHALVILGETPYWQGRSQELRVDADGKFKTPAQKPGQLRLTVIAPGYAPESQMVDVTPEMEEVDFPLLRGNKLEIHFVDEAGNPASGIFVGIEEWRGAESLHNRQHPNIIATGIPAKCDDNGIYVWDWAPQDPVTFSFGGGPFYYQRRVKLSANEQPIKIVMKRYRELSGRVTDLDGNPIPSFSVIPRFHLNKFMTREQRSFTARAKDGEFLIKLESQPGQYSLKVEADGYQPAVTPMFHSDDLSRTFNIQLTPAKPIQYRVVDEKGQPVPDATISVAPLDQVLLVHQFIMSDIEIQRTLNTKSDESGFFILPSSTQARTIMASHKDGYGELGDKPAAPVTTIKLLRWSAIKGMVNRDGQPWQATCGYTPIRYHGASFHLQMIASEKTNGEGRFHFRNLAAMPARISFFGTESPQGIRYNIAVSPKPGEEVQIDFSKATRVKGAVKLEGSNREKVGLVKSRVILSACEPSVELPPELEAEIKQNGLEGKRPSEVKQWFSDQENWHAWRSFGDCFDHYTLSLDEAGEFSTDILRPGTYELEIFPHAQSTSKVLGEQLAEFRTTIEIGELPTDSGEFVVPLFDDPQPGTVVEDVGFKILSDNADSSLSKYRGSYVLLDFWNPWCDSCEADTPKVHRLAAMLAAQGQVTMISLAANGSGPTIRLPSEIPQGLQWLNAQLAVPDEQQVRRRLGVWTSQHFVLIDPEGNYVAGGTLPVIAKELEKRKLK